MASTSFPGANPSGEARKREQILCAQLRALESIPELFQITSDARSPKEACDFLRTAWQLSEIQAQAVLEMQVQKFTRLECMKVRDELTAIRDYIKERFASGN